MKKLLLLAFVMIICAGGCKNNQAPNSKNDEQIKELYGYFDEELDTKALVKVDTTLLQKELEKIVPWNQIIELYGSGYQNFYLRLLISANNEKSFVLFPDATYLDRNKGVSERPLLQQDVKYDLMKYKIFFSAHTDQNNIFTVRAGSIKGKAVKCLKSFELHTFIGKDKGSSRPWTINEVSITNYLPQFVDKRVDESWFDGFMPLTSKDAFEAIRKNIIYPEAALKNGVTGRVFVQLFSDENGNYAGYKLIKGLGYGCDEAVIKAIKSVKIEGYPTGQRGSTIVPFEFGVPQTSPIDLAVADFGLNQDKNNYCNLHLMIVNKNRLDKSINKVYWTYVYIDNKLAFMNCAFGGVSESFTQQTFFFRWKPEKPGSYEYAIYIDPEKRLNDSNRENNTVKGFITVD